MILPKEIQNIVEGLKFKKDNIGRSGDEIYFFENKYVLKISTDIKRIEREKNLNDWLKDKLSVPITIAFCVFNNKAYYLTTKLSGKPLYSVKNKKLLIDLLVSAINLVHSVSIQNCDFISQDNVGETFIHGDFCLPNILIENDKISGIIDLENAGIGDKWYDYAWAFWSLQYNIKTNKYNDYFFKTLNVDFNENLYRKYIPKDYIEQVTFLNANQKIDKNIIDFIHKFYPQSTISFIDEGYHSKAYKINNDYVLKISKNQDGSKNIKKECEILKKLQDKLTINIPKVINNGSLNLNNSKHYFSICTLIKGKKLSKKEFNNLSKDKQRKIAFEVANFLTELHSLKIDIPYKISKIKELKTQLKFIKNNYFSNFNTKIQENIIDFYKKEIEFAEKNSNSTCFIHNDFSATNIIFDDNNNLCGVIDFADAGIGDADNDFLYLLEQSSEEFGIKFGRIVLKFYKHTNPKIVMQKAKRKNNIWKLEKLYYGTLYNNKRMVNQSLKLINKYFCN